MKMNTNLDESQIEALRQEIREGTSDRVVRMKGEMRAAWNAWSAIDYAMDTPEEDAVRQVMGWAPRMKRAKLQSLFWDIKLMRRAKLMGG